MNASFGKALAANAMHESLRSETFHEHRRLDARFSLLNPRSRYGYAAFLIVHDMALTDCARLLDDFRQQIDIDFAQMKLRIEQDLDSLGVDPPQPWRSAFEAELPVMSVRYVLDGARLGARQILARVRSSEDRDVASATTFLDGQTDLRPWRRTLRDLANYPGDEGRLIAGAKRVFLTFEMALRDSTNINKEVLAGAVSQMAATSKVTQSNHSAIK